MRDFFISLKKRPIILIFVALATAAGCFAVQFNSFTKEFGSLGRLFKTDYPQLLTDMASWLKSRATDPTLLATTVAVAILSLFAISVIGAFFVSGLSYIMYVNTYNGIHRIPKKRNTFSLFREGVNKRFLSMAVYIFFALLILVVMAGLLAYLIMPVSVAVSKVISGDTSQIIPMLLLVVVIIVVTFFSVVFFSMYTAYLIPSIVAFKKGAVRVAFKIVNSYCWYLIPRTLLFLVYNLAIEVAMLALNYGNGFGRKTVVISITMLACNWLLRTMGILYYSHYVFKTYIEMKEDMFDEA
ncbi:MAG: hypothetical protein K6G89_01700 [Clostridia bacterium]|nr:hypothetical protein [Clostridia bacterium]